MNLLVDQRQDNAEQESSEPFSYSAIPLTDEPTETPPRVEAGSNYFEYDRHKTEKKSYFAPLFLIGMLVVAILASIYFGFIYKEGDLAFISRLWHKKSKMEIAPATEDKKPIIAAPGVAVGIRGNDPLAVAAKAYSSIFNAIPDQIRPLTLVSSSHSFSLEASAENKEVMQAFHSDFNRTFASELSFSPILGAEKRVIALLNGALDGHKERVETSVIDAAGFKNEVEAMARAADVSVVEILSMKDLWVDGRKRTPVFVKVRGSRTALQNFCSAVADKEWKLQFDKLIVMTNQNGADTLVLRIQVIQPA